MLMIHKCSEINSNDDPPKLLLFLQHFKIIYLLFFLVVVVVPFGNPLPSENLTFTFDGFDPNMHDIVYEGDAHSSNGAIQLTVDQVNKGMNDSAGRATYSEPMKLWDKASGNVADFNTHFSFVIDTQNQTRHGEGFAFFLAPNDSKLLNCSQGGNLGLLSIKSPKESSTFVAVEFDTNTDPWDHKEPDHVGINLDSMESVNVTEWLWSGIIANGGRAKAWISYDSSSHNLSLLLTDDTGLSNANFTSLYYQVDFPKYLPEWVTFGFSGATGEFGETHSILSWDFNSSLQIGSSKKTKTWLWLGVGAATVASFLILIALVWFGCWMKRCRREKKDIVPAVPPSTHEKDAPPIPIYMPASATMDEDEDEVDVESSAAPRKFSYNELVIATNNFAVEGLLGEGGFGRVYKGFLSTTDDISTSTSVAVKKINPESRQGMKEYASEVTTIIGLRHRNLVKLIGWCREKMELLIVYDFMPNKSLDFHLFKGGKHLLTWEERYRIALGLASALFYMQEECDQCVLHRDIKPSNVLLDSNFNAKLGDFGLARLVDHGQGSRTTNLIGTKGYMAPEYLQNSKATKESDIYSFGIVTLEIACGKRAMEQGEANGKKFVCELVKVVWRNYGRGNVLEAADPRLGEEYDVEQMERLIIVGLWCAHPDYNSRPSVRQVMDVLNFKAPLPVLPPTMPVSTFVHPPLFVSSSHGTSGSERGGQTQYSGNSCNTGSSKCTSSSTATQFSHT